MSHKKWKKPSFIQSNKGFSLIELMIVVVIIGILAAVGIPSYKSYVVNAKVADAFPGLNELAAKAQLFYMDNKNFDGYPCTTQASAANYVFSCNKDTTAGTDALTDCPVAGSGSGMAVQSIVFCAKGTGDLANFIFTLDATGAKTTTFNGVAKTCWVTSNSGTC
jgi:type IV pilus assembly protein PilE